MALTFNNGVVTDTERNQTYDLNPYGQSAAGSKDSAGNIGALHSFYDAWNVKNQPDAVTNPTGARLGGAQYNIGLMDKNLTNKLSNEGSALLPQITEWYNKIRAGQPNALTGEVSQQQATPQTGASPVTKTNQRQTQFNALTGQSAPSAPPMQVASDVNNGRGPVPASDPFFSTVNAGQPSAGGAPAPAPTAPRTSSTGTALANGSQVGAAGTTLAPGAVQPAPTGVGAGRGYPSNWNANNAPGLASSGEGTTFATNPMTGASYETSPMYQWQLKQGEKAINRQLRARGRYNSSVGANTLANFYNSLGAAEADKQYGRTFDQQKLGLQAALAQAGMYGNIGRELSSGSSGYGTSIADLIDRYAKQEGANVLSRGTQEGAAAMWKGTPIGALLEKTGGENADFWTSLAAMGGEAVNAYMKNRK